MENGLVTEDGTNVLTVEEYYNFIQAIPENASSENASVYRDAEFGTTSGLTAFLRKNIWPEKSPDHNLLRL